VAAKAYLSDSSQLMNSPFKVCKSSKIKGENYERLIDELHKRGIMVNASLVFGFDHDSPQVFQNTLDWLVKNKVETMTAHILTPYPGTVLYQRFLAEGRITDFDLSHYNTANVVFTPKRMTQEELLKGYLWIYQEFYSFKNISKEDTGSSQAKSAVYFI
jgi:radical SAM superfamily enzyme YgiQ (UPF0313 family)